MTAAVKRSLSYLRIPTPRAIDLLAYPFSTADHTASIEAAANKDSRRTRGAHDSDIAPAWSAPAFSAKAT